MTKLPTTVHIFIYLYKQFYEIITATINYNSQTHNFYAFFPLYRTFFCVIASFPCIGKRNASEYPATLP